MTRTEYNEFRYIKGYANEKKWGKLGYGTILSIRVDASPDYKHRLHDLYMSWGFHPASIRVHEMLDDKERIIYVYGANEVYHDLYGREFTWEALFTDKEKARFAQALN